ncbi:hypothetical protein VCHC41A1_1295, partial [Vibrio cholerae HC-41A1]
MIASAIPQPAEP